MPLAHFLLRYNFKNQSFNILTSNTNTISMTSDKGNNENIEQPDETAIGTTRVTDLSFIFQAFVPFPGPSARLFWRVGAVHR